MKYRWCTPLLVLLLIAHALPAQESVITEETPVDQSTLNRWLHSQDPRLITWAADFARRKHDLQLTTAFTRNSKRYSSPHALC
jgi:hypothetical protein